MKRLLRYLFPLVLLGWGLTALYPVDYAEFAYVTRFGKRVEVVDGEADAGLHFKLPWPIDSTSRIDRRMQSFDLPAVEALTRDPKKDTIDRTVTVDAFVTWRVPDATAADQFVRATGNPEQVKKLLAPQISGRLATVVGGMTLDELASVPSGDPVAAVTGAAAVFEPAALGVVRQALADGRAEVLQQKLRADGFVPKVREQYGVEIVTLRLRRLTFPEAVRGSIYERIRAERTIKVAEYENEGRQEVARITADADQRRRVIEATARAEKQRIEGEADVKTDQLRNEAHAKDPEFYAFLQRLKAMQQVLAESRDVLLLSLNHELFRLLKEPPKQPQPGK